MHWLFPGFLLGAWAVGLPILLHLLRRRPKRTVPFPSLRFLAVTAPQNARSQRLRRWIVLLLRCLALGLLAAAFARPFFGSDRLGRGRTNVVVVDNSFSLQAGQRWAALRDWLRPLLGKPTDADRIGILVTAPRPKWIAPPNTSAETALQLLQSLKPGWETARLEPALRLAGDTLAGLTAGQREIILLTDHQQLSWATFDFGQKLPPGVTALFPNVPAPLARQAAIQAPVITRTATGFHAVVAIRNFTGAHDRTLRVYRDNGIVPLYQQTVSLPEHEAQKVEFDLPGAATDQTAYFRCVLEADDLPADDTAYAAWQATGGRGVLLDPLPPGSTADYVGAALASTIELKPALQISPRPSTAWPATAVAVLRNDASFAGDAGQRLDGFLRSGGSAVVFVNGGPAQTKWLAAAGIKVQPLKETDGLELRDWAMEHPLVTGLAAHRVSALLGWTFRRGWALPLDRVEPVALWSETAAAMGEASVGRGRLLLCGFTADRRDGEWPTRETFVPFVHRAVAYLFGAEASAAAKPAQVGEVLALPADAGQWRAVAGPAVGENVVSVAGSVTPTAPGVYEFTSGAERKLFAVNLAPEESDPTLWNDGTPWLALESHARAPAAARMAVALGAEEAERKSPLWWWLIAIVALCALAELGVANRTSR